MSSILRVLTDVFFRNLGMKLVAIGLAAVLFVLTRDEVTRAFEVPLSVVRDPDRVLLTDLPRTVTVKVRGPWTRVNRLQDIDLGTAALDLRSAEPGPLEVDQASIVMPSGVLLANVQYPHVDLRFEPIVTQPKKITPNVEGLPAADYRVSQVKVTPPSWSLRGGRSVVQGVSRLSTDVLDIAGRTSTVTQSLSIVRPPGELALVAPDGESSRVEVRVEIEPITESREIVVPIAVPDDLDPRGKIPKTYQVQVSGPLPSFRALDGLEVSFPVDARVVPLEGRREDGGQVVEVRFGWSEAVPSEVRSALSIDHGVERIIIPPPPAPAPPVEPPA